MHGNISDDGDRGAIYEGGFVRCPECGEAAVLHIWGSGVDAELECSKCDISDIIR